MRIIGWEPKELDETVAKIDFWYDRSLKLWTCLWVNADGDQLGSAQYANNRAEMKLVVDSMKTTAPADYQIGI